MPKIIENPEQRLMEEAKRQIETSGYSAMTIRSVAKSCGIGIGTVYNYFTSKEDLVAKYMLQDWMSRLEAIETFSNQCHTCGEVLGCIFHQLQSYASVHRHLFHDEGAVSGFAGSFSRYHTLLRSQLAAPVRKFCPDDFTAEFVAEAILTWTMAGKEFEEIYSIISKII